MTDIAEISDAEQPEVDSDVEKQYPTFETLPNKKVFLADDSTMPVFVQHAASLAAAAGVNIVAFSGDTPSGWSISVTVLKESRKQKDGATRREPVALVIWPIPTLAHVFGESEDWVSETVHDALITALLRPVRAAEDLSKVGDEMPTTIADFITSRRREGKFGVFVEYAPKILKALKRMFPKSERFRSLTPLILRQLCESSAFAASVDASLEEAGQWVKLIQGMRRTAVKEGKPTAVFDEWLATRDDTALVEIEAESVDFDALFDADEDADSDSE